MMECFLELARCPCVHASRCICMSSLSCGRIGWMRECLICKCGEGCGYLFCKIAIVSFLSIGYKSDGLYCRMAGTPSSPTLFFIRVEICECHCPPPHTPTLPNTEGVGWHLDLDTNLSTGFSLKHTHTHAHTLPDTEGVGRHLDLDSNLSTPLSNTHTHTYTHTR